MQDIKAWIEAVKLKLNEAKNKFIYFGSRQQLSKATHTTINVIGETITRSKKSDIWGDSLTPISPSKTTYISNAKLQH